MPIAESAQVKRMLSRKLIPPLILLGCVLAAWQGVVWAFDVPAYLLPPPYQVARAAVGSGSNLMSATAVTALGAVCGFLASLIVGIFIGLVFSQSSIIRTSCYPYAIFLQTVPIVAIAPLIVIWSGTGLRSVVLTSAIISLFPIVTNVTSGLITIDAGLGDLFRLHRATRWQTMWRLQIPNSLPCLVTGARISSGLAVVGAIVGEFFVGYGATRHGLGYIILYAGPQLKTDELFAATVASSLLGVAIFGVVSLVGHRLLSQWHDAPLN